jgi:hypothetical protein
MRVHLYAQCWNDVQMLPYFFRHYDEIVDRYFIYDDKSTDGSRALLSQHPSVELREFPRAAGSFVLSEQKLSNNCWKESSKTADWVIVTDIDEFLFHPDLRSYLSDSLRRGVNLIPALGYQMISEIYPEPHQNLTQSYRRGAPWGQMMKASIFDPQAFSEINFSLGRHRVEPDGQVKIPALDELLLFHYKYLGFEETHARHQELGAGLGPVDIENRWGHKYLWSEAELRSDWDMVDKQAVDTDIEARTLRRDYPFQPWWSKYRLVVDESEGRMRASGCAPAGCAPE